MFTPSLAGQKEQKVTKKIIFKWEKFWILHLPAFGMVLHSKFLIMFINLTYIFILLVAIYLAIDTYLYTRKWQVFPMLFIFLFSLGLEIDWLQSGNFGLDLNHFLWTLRDVLRTAGMVLFFRCMRNHFPHHKTGIIKKKTTKKTKK